MQVDGSTLFMPTYFVFLLATLLLFNSGPLMIFYPLFFISFQFINYQSHVPPFNGFFQFQQHLHVDYGYSPTHLTPIFWQIVSVFAKETLSLPNIVSISLPLIFSITFTGGGEYCGWT